MRRPVLIFCAATAVILSGCEKKAPPADIVTPVKVETVAPVDSANALSYSAQVVPETSLDLAFRTDGYVTDIATRPGAGGKSRLLQPGDSVAAGEVLASIEDRQYKDRLVTAQANLDASLAAQQKADEDWRRAKALKETQSITEPDFDSAQQQFSTAQASVSGARAQRDEALNKLEETKLIAPQAAVVNDRKIELGALVRPGSVGFVLVNTTTVKVVFGIPEQVLGKVSLGDEIGVRVVSMPERVFNGTVTQIAPAADQRTRVFEVSISVDNTSGELKQGMIASLAVDVADKSGDIVWVPLNSIIRSTDGSFAVYVAERNEAGAVVKLTPVQTGEINGNNVMVTEGLKAGQEIVISGTAQVKDGQTVNILR